MWLNVILSILILRLPHKFSLVENVTPRFISSCRTVPCRPGQNTNIVLIWNNLSVYCQKRLHFNNMNNIKPNYETYHSLLLQGYFRKHLNISRDSDTVVIDRLVQASKDKHFNMFKRIFIYSVPLYYNKGIIQIESWSRVLLNGPENAVALHGGRAVQCARVTL